MATTKPRITITLTEHQHDVLKSISAASGSSMSSLAGELIEVSLPTLERMANTFQKLRNAHTIERAKMVEAMEESLSVLEPIAAAAVDQFDLFLGNIEQAEGGAPDGSGATPAAPSTAPTAPATNRGATTPKAKPRKPRPARDTSVFQKSTFLKKSEA